MRKYKIGMFLLMFCMVLAGCGKEKVQEEKVVITTEPIEEGGYRTVHPFNASDAREVHTIMNLSSYDMNAAGKGLERYSKKYFSTDSYYLQDGQLLTRDRLQINQSEVDPEGLLNRNSADNPYGLNPAKGTTIPVGDGVTIKVGSSTIPIIDLIEYDFVQESKKDAEIKGISVAIILNPNIVDADGKKHTISNENLKLIGEEAGRKLITYLKTLPEVGANTPVMIGLFQLDAKDASLGGSYLALGYGKQGIDRFESLDETWVIIPSEEASKLDAQTSAQFTAVKNSLKNVLPNDVGIIGRGFYIDKRLNSLHLTVTTTGKSYSENLSVVQLMVGLLDNFNDDSYSVTVRIEANLETIAMLQRNAGSKEIKTIME